MEDHTGDAGELRRSCVISRFDKDQVVTARDPLQPTTHGFERLASSAVRTDGADGRRDDVDAALLIPIQIAVIEQKRAHPVDDERIGVELLGVVVAHTAVPVSETSGANSDSSSPAMRACHIVLGSVMSHGRARWQEASIVPDDGVAAAPLVLVHPGALAGLVDEFGQEPLGLLPRETGNAVGVTPDEQ